MFSDSKYAALEDRLGYKFRDRRLLQTALTHKSLRDRQSYERLEFLGDRLLGLVVAEALYKRFPNENEGGLSKRMAGAVSRTRLASIVSSWRLEETVEVDDDLRAQGFGTQKALHADICEALLAAIYLDSDIETLRCLVLTHWREALDDDSAKQSDSRSRLQEWCQARSLPLPLYETTNVDGPAHKLQFTINVSLQQTAEAPTSYAKERIGTQAAEAIASSKKEAMSKAAALLLDKLGRLEDGG